MTRFFLPVVAIAIVMSFLKLGTVTLFDYDEAVFAEATKEMVQTGNWITPTYNGENRYDKPIFFYWLMAASYKVFGINELGARFPSAAASFLLALSIFFFVRHFKNGENGFYAAASLILSIYFVVYSHAAVTDMTLTLFITLSLFSFYLCHINKEKASSDLKKNLYICGFYLFSALAFLTKGLIGIIFPFTIVIVYLLVTEGVSGLKKIFNLKGLILFIIIAAPWYMAQLRINGQEFIQQFFIKHHFTRYTDVNSGHQGPVYYFIPVLLIGLFPWIVFLPAGIKNALKTLKSKALSSQPSALSLQSSPLDLFALIWFALIVVFFSFSTTKLPNYILSSIPAAVILISSGMATEDKKWQIYSNIVMAIISVATGSALILSRKYLLTLGLSGINWIFVIAAILFVTAILNIIAVMTGKLVHAYIAGLALISLTVLSINAFPLASQQLQATLHKYSLYAKNHLPEGRRVIAYGLNNPSLVFYSDRRVLYMRNKDELGKTDNAPLAITKAEDIETIENAGFKLVETDGKYALLEKK